MLASVSRCLVDGEDAVVLGHVSQRLKSNGKAFTIPFALHLNVSGGLITRYHVYEDSLTVAEAVTAYCRSRTKRGLRWSHLCCFLFPAQGLR